MFVFDQSDFTGPVTLHATFRCNHLQRVPRILHTGPTPAINLQWDTRYPRGPRYGEVRAPTFFHLLSQSLQTLLLLIAASIVVKYRYSRRKARNEPPQRGPRVFDGAGRIFSMYLEMALEEDKKLAESWEADADGVLIFVGLYYLLPCNVTCSKAGRLVYSPLPSRP